MRWLVVGLGNPGPDYATTRHNVGAMVVEQMARSAGVKFTSHKSQADIAEIKYGIGSDRTVLTLARSHSYMNNSGGATVGLANYFDIPAERIIALHDELDIPFATIRVKLGGGDNGHNGLKSITKSLGTESYFRIRLGIGRPTNQQDPGDFVLKQFSGVEKKELEQFISRAAGAVEFLVSHGLTQTQQEFNS